MNQKAGKSHSRLTNWQIKLSNRTVRKIFCQFRCCSCLFQGTEWMNALSCTLSQHYITYLHSAFNQKQRTRKAPRWGPFLWRLILINPQTRFASLLLFTVQGWRHPERHLGPEVRALYPRQQATVHLEQLALEYQAQAHQPILLYHGVESPLVLRPRDQSTN